MVLTMFFLEIRQQNKQNRSMMKHPSTFGAQTKKSFSKTHLQSSEVGDARSLCKWDGEIRCSRLPHYSKRQNMSDK